jgi:hypothetical protein
VGDCGVRIVRRGSIVFETAPQQHDFNLPYQLSHPRMFPQTDTADDADMYAPHVQRGDIVLLGSDGLLDNVWDEELARVVRGRLPRLPRRFAAPRGLAPGRMPPSQPPGPPGAPAAAAAAGAAPQRCAALGPGSTRWPGPCAAAP